VTPPAKKLFETGGISGPGGKRKGKKKKRFESKKEIRGGVGVEGGSLIGEKRKVGHQK
jgi:hypothetical protein